MKVQRIRDVKLPSRGTSASAGIDFFVPNDFEPKTLKIGEHTLIPSGVKVQVPEGHAMVAFNKSGVATKNGLIVGACVVDEDYEGEVHLHVINVTDGEVAINPGMKLTQFVLLPVNYSTPEEVYQLESRNTERGSGGFGSTGIN
jgi:dUTP pyrophosphatase